MDHPAVNPLSTRHPDLMSAGETALVVVDVQEKLVPVIPNYHALIWQIRRLVDAARLVENPVIATEQYPQGLGPTVSILSESLPQAFEKKCFSAIECLEPFRELREKDIFRILLTGIEAHVCIQQTALDLQTMGFRVYVAVDAVSSRHKLDYEWALRRMESSGVILTTAEAVLFEWCQSAAAPAWKAGIRDLVRENAPESD
ncbi:Isochorismatase domain-containing protein 2 [Planctomycetales bacterium 10988]|nr:Isochorismatase domain-containing protein 2 [Planctomycetales bacterium 10988]